MNYLSFSFAFFILLLLLLYYILPKKVRPYILLGGNRKGTGRKYLEPYILDAMNK